VGRRQLDDVVAFLPQRGRAEPLAIAHDLDGEHAHARLLHLGDDLRETVVRAHDDHVADTPGPCQRGQVSANGRLYALGAAGSGLAQPELEAGQIGQRVMLARAPIAGHIVIPVAAENGEPGPLLGEPGEQLEEARVVPGHRVAMTSTVDGHGPVAEHIARIHEQRATIHANPSFPRRETLPARGRASGQIERIAG
jgi:hypothetical protein